MRNLGIFLLCVWLVCCMGCESAYQTEVCNPPAIKGAHWTKLDNGLECVKWGVAMHCNWRKWEREQLKDK